jgi:quinol monooxygenase YgiN
MSETVEVCVIVEAQAKPGKEQELRARLLDVIAPSREETSCRHYHLHEDLDAPGRFLSYETWSSRGAFEEHRQSAHMQRLNAAIGELLASPLRVNVLTMLS